MVPHNKRIDWTFALAATLVTKEQFLRFQPELFPRRDEAPSRTKLPDRGCGLVRSGEGTAIG